MKVIMHLVEAPLFFEKVNTLVLDLVGWLMAKRVVSYSSNRGCSSRHAVSSKAVDISLPVRLVRIGIH